MRVSPAQSLPTRFLRTQGYANIIFRFEAKFCWFLGQCITSTTQLPQLVWRLCRMFVFTSPARTNSAAEQTSTVRNGLVLDTFSSQYAPRSENLSSEYATFCGNLGHAPGERSYS
jgi:hypothetical protein